MLHTLVYAPGRTATRNVWTITTLSVISRPVYRRTVFTACNHTAPAPPYDELSSVGWKLESARRWYLLRARIRYTFLPRILFHAQTDESIMRGKGGKKFTTARRKYVSRAEQKL